MIWGSDLLKHNIFRTNMLYLLWVKRKISTNLQKSGYTLKIPKHAVGHDRDSLNARVHVCLLIFRAPLHCI